MVECRCSGRNDDSNDSWHSEKNLVYEGRNVEKSNLVRKIQFVNNHTSKTSTLSQKEES